MRVRAPRRVRAWAQVCAVCVPVNVRVVADSAAGGACAGTITAGELSARESGPPDDPTATTSHMLAWWHCLGTIVGLLSATSAHTHTRVPTAHSGSLRRALAAPLGLGEVLARRPCAGFDHKKSITFS